MNVSPPKNRFLILRIFSVVLLSINGFGQTITQPSSGASSTSITCGTTYSFLDPGGTGDYGNNLNSVLTINPSTAGQFVQIDFSTGPFDVEPDGTGCFDFINIYDGTSAAAPLIGTFCNSNIPTTITSSTGSLTVEFDTDVATIGAGWDADVICTATPGPIIQPSSGTSSTTIACGSTFTFLDPGGTGDYGNNLNSVLTINPSTVGQFVQIDFSTGPFDVEPDGTGCFDFINIYDGTSTAAALIGTFCNSNIPTTITSSTGSLTVEFDTDGATIGTGWDADISCTAAPGPIIHPASGTTATNIVCGTTYSYMDPGGTGSYGDNQLSTYTFNPSAAGAMIQIDFSAGPFDVEPNGAGCFDFIEIYDGTSTAAPLLGTFCNSNIPGSISSTTGSLTVVFDSDGGVVGTGWLANITCCTTVSGTAFATPNSFCPAAGNTSLSLSAPDGAASIQWQVSTDAGVTWANIPGATTNPFVQAVAVNSSYRALVTNGCTTNSNMVDVGVGCPDILHPTSGAVTSSIECGGTYKFYDSGGSGSNYSNDESGIITLCPTVSGQFVSVNINSINISADDYLYVFDGYGSNSQIISVHTGTTLASGTITASSANTSGCLSFRLYSTSATTASGWDFDVSCSASAGAALPAAGIEDCAGTQVICSNGPLVGGTSGAGFIELPQSEWAPCLFDPGEAESQWYAFSSTTDGTVGFEIVPTAPTDYDWAIWGPYNSLQCPTFTGDISIRCNASSLANSGPNGETGLIVGATDVLERNGDFAGEVTDGDLQPLDVLAGEIYIMMLDNWSASAIGFELNWSLTNGASLDCAPIILPVNLTSFNSDCEENKTVLNWSTASEINNNFFIVEKSDASFNFREIGKIFGNGNSTNNNEYSFVDAEINAETTYYRLVQIDFDGTAKYHPTITSNCQDYTFEVVQSSLNDGNLNLSITSSTNENLVIQLYDSSGKLITDETKELRPGINAVSIQNLSISTGIYFVSVRGEYHYASVKLFAP